MKTKSIVWLSLLLMTLIITACAEEVEMPTPVAVIVDPTLEPTVTPLPTLMSEAGTPVEESEVDDQMSDPAQAEVAKLFAESLGLQPAGESAMGIEGAYAFSVTVPQKTPPQMDKSFMLAHTIGIRSFDPLQNHVIALFTQEAGVWQELTRIELVDANLDAAETNTTTTSTTETEQQPVLAAPDYLGEGSVNQVQIEADHLWLTVEGGVGAHSGVFNLLRYNNATLQPEATGFNSSPGVAQIRDLNDDGIQELLLDASDYYVFCYACGVRLAQYVAMRWDGEKMVEIDLTPLPESAPPALRQMNDQAIALAEAGLWKDALTLLAEGENAQLGTSDETFLWNRAVIQLTGEARRQQAEAGDMAYPLLDKVFYGDFAGAVDGIRGFAASSIFSVQSPLIIGTAAEGNDQQLADRLLAATESGSEQATQVADRAAAHFLRGWAYFLKGEQEAAVTALQAASTLAPADQLLQDSVAFVENN